MRTRIKFCGCAGVADAMLAVETGADAIGMIFAPSPRRITESAAKYIAEQLPPFITPVGVFVDPSLEDIARARAIFPDLVIQLHGRETPAFVSSLDGKVIKALRVDPDESEANKLEQRSNEHPRAILLFDTSVGGQSGGTGRTFPWKIVAPIAKGRQIIVGGGLTPENVKTCVRAVRPFGVDVRSGIETDNKKDREKMRRFVLAVKEGDAA
ncbi:MAG TPA: phosphoribosylanthranilate isomerase [Candidatus Baltobacteraceae bacterium]|nr:phosphoribosylanthranilate isomerase [Candidatus Baltobacteraceae bacterium]